MASKRKKKIKPAPRTRVSEDDARRLAAIIVGLLAYPIPPGWREDEQALITIRDMFPRTKVKNTAMIANQIVAFFNGEFDIAKDA